MLTLVVLAVVAALIALANLSFDAGETTPFWWRSYGWPVVWRRCVGGHHATIGWYYSVGRLAGNVALWLLMMAGLGAMCEWLARRYRPRPRWRLRTLFVAVGLAALLCSWLAKIRDRANAQDAIISQVRPLHAHGLIWVEHRGPQSLSVLGADRLRRHIIGADIDGTNAEGNNEELLGRLARLPNLRYVFIDVSRLTPRLVDALNQMRGLQILSVQRRVSLGRERDEDGMPTACLAAIGRMKNLERLRLAGIDIAGTDLELLAGLTNLKLLSFDDGGARYELSWLTGLPALPQLEAIELTYSYSPFLAPHGNVTDEDVRHLAVLPRLRSLALWSGTEDFAAVDLGSLACLESLEEVQIDNYFVSARRLDSLRAVKRLKRVHLYDGVSYGGMSVKLAELPLDGDDEVRIPESELAGCRRALAALRQAKPGIVIDNDDPVGWPVVWGTAYDILPADVRWSTPDASPDWLPGNSPLLTTAERARFESRGGWARFDAAGNVFNGEPIEVKF